MVTFWRPRLTFRFFKRGSGEGGGEGGLQMRKFDNNEEEYSNQSLIKFVVYFFHWGLFHQELRKQNRKKKIEKWKKGKKRKEKKGKE